MIKFSNEKTKDSEESKSYLKTSVTYDAQELFKDSTAPYAVSWEEDFKKFCQNFADALGDELNIDYYDNLYSCDTNEAAIAGIFDGDGNHYYIYRSMYIVPKEKNGVYYICEDTGTDGMTFETKAIYSKNNRYILTVTNGDSEYAAGIFVNISD